ncbi:MAG: pyridoxal-phosphate dependent enzyme [Phycisphaerales bacterium]|nr:pyridoxal-phosphate dependent enzyme [Phycisphaerales bacterium]
MDWIKQRVHIGKFPTPVFDAERLRPGLWIKDDGCCHNLVAGNKVRKLEYLFAQGDGPVATMGAVGSHHILATAVHGARLGRPVKAVVFGRPFDEHASQVLAATLPLVSVEMAKNQLQAFKKLQQLGRYGAVIPAGGSSPVGVLGFVAAGLELAQQIRLGLCPEPRKCFVPLGTAGTAVGLAMGFHAAGLETRVIGVRVVPEAWLSVQQIEQLARDTSRITKTDAMVPEINNRFLGAGYGHHTALTQRSVALARSMGFALEETYTGKALAAALDDSGGPDLYWQTHSTQSLSPLLAGAPVPKPQQWGWTSGVFA